MLAQRETIRHAGQVVRAAPRMGVSAREVGRQIAGVSQVVREQISDNLLSTRFSST